MVIGRLYTGVCVISADSCVGAVDDGKCSPWVICNCVKSPVMWEWPLVVSGAMFMAWIRDITRESSSNTVTLQGQNMQTEDTAVYYCARESQWHRAVTALFKNHINTRHTNTQLCTKIFSISDPVSVIFNVHKNEYKCTVSQESNAVHNLGHPQTSVICQKGIVPQTKRLQKQQWHDKVMIEFFICRSILKTILLLKQQTYMETRECLQKKIHIYWCVTLRKHLRFIIASTKISEYACIVS